MAVVVVIVITLMSLGLGVLNSQLASAAQAETKKRQAVIKEALVAYLGAHKRLPCPDDPDTPNPTESGSPAPEVTGKEDRDGAGTCVRQIGVVPYATLGLSREVALDGWSNFMSYSIPAGDPNCKDTVMPYWSREDCLGVAKNPESLYSLYGGTRTAPIPVATNVLAVVISHGPNGFAAWGRQGNRQNVAGMRCEETHNARTGICSSTPSKEFSANDFFGGEFSSEVDDLVIALTREEAINRLIMEGTLRSAEGKLVEDLARLRSEMLYKMATGVKVAGECPTPATTEPDPDPWGAAYEIEKWEGDFPVCICSTRGSAAPLMQDLSATAPKCSYTTPTTCVQVKKDEVNLLRMDDQC